MKHRSALLLGFLNIFLLATAPAPAATLVWNPVAGATGYRVRLGTNSGVYQVTNQVAAGVTNFPMVGLAPGAYFATVVALSTNGVAVVPPGVEGAPSIEAQFFVLPAPIIRLESRIESAPTLDGPWQEEAAARAFVLAPDPSRFYRSRLEASP